LNYKNNDLKGKVFLTVIAIATLLVMAFSSNTYSLNVDALDLGLISKDTNIGSIDTDSLFNCVGAAITCDNDNTVSNNVATNNGTSQPNGPDASPCVQCFINANLSPAQQQSIFEVYGVTSFENVCNILSGAEVSVVFDQLSTLIDVDEASAIVNCLLEAGILVNND
jgi:hypothetical protein